MQNDMVNDDEQCWEDKLKRVAKYQDEDRK